MINETENGALSASNIIAGGVIGRITGGTSYMMLKNDHGDVVGLTANGEVKADYTYSAYGELIADGSNGINNPIRYAGEYTDEESGLIYLRARYYDPGLGRFISEDPIRDGANWYAYCAGNPVMFVDPSGNHQQKVYDEVDGGIGVVAVREDLRTLLEETNGVLKIEGRTIYIKALGGFAAIDIDAMDSEHLVDNHLHFTCGEFFELLGLEYEKQSMRVNVTQDEYKNASMKYEIQKWGINQVTTIFGKAIEGGASIIFDTMTSFLDVFYEDPYAEPAILPPGTYQLNQYTVEGKLVLQQRIRISAGNYDADSDTVFLSWNPENPDYFYDVLFGWEYPY